MATAILRLDWNQAYAPEGINNYRLYCNDVIVSNTTTLQHIMNNIVYGVEYVFYVVAITLTGRVSAKSNILTIIINELGPGEPSLNYNLNFDL